MRSCSYLRFLLSSHLYQDFKPKHETDDTEDDASEEDAKATAPLLVRGSKTAKDP